MSTTTTQGTDETGGIPPAVKVAVTRRRHRALAGGGPYGALLGELWGAQGASDRAEPRPANGKRRRDFGRYSGAESNYRASRAGRLRDYGSPQPPRAGVIGLTCLSGHSPRWRGS